MVHIAILVMLASLQIEEVCELPHALDALLGSNRWFPGILQLMAVGALDDASTWDTDLCLRRLVGKIQIQNRLGDRTHMKRENEM